MKLGKYLLPLYGILALVYLMVPIVYTIAFSFNDSNRTNIIWNGFTVNNWLNVCDAQGVCEAFVNSIVIAVASTLVATVLGTAISIALVRYKFKGRAATTLLLFMPMATPEVVLGAGLAAQFLNAGVPKGMLTVILAHIMFSISFVVVTVRARVAGIDPRLEEAGRDLYAKPSQVWWKITFQLLMPGIVSAALLAFALSFDDFIITNFNRGPVNTLPSFIYTAAARGIPAEANVLASAVFILAILAVVITQVGSEITRRRLKANA